MEPVEVIRGRRKNIRHPQRALGGLEEDGRWAAREALDVAGHMGLIAIAYVCGQFCEAPSTAYAAS